MLWHLSLILLAISVFVADLLDVSPMHITELREKSVPSA
jgi:hypothetical protein